MYAHQANTHLENVRFSWKGKVRSYQVLSFKMNGKLRRPMLACCVCVCYFNLIVRLIIMQDSDNGHSSKISSHIDGIYVTIWKLAFYARIFIIL